MTTTERRAAALGGALSPNVQTLRVQPVAPAEPTWLDTISTLTASLATAFLGALFVMLGANALHAYYPIIAPLGYWDAWMILLGLSSLGLALTGSRAWKWARR